MTKELVKAWFRGNFEFIRPGSTPSRKSFVVVRRQPFLKEYLNPFLESVGLQKWSSRSPLYSDWFIKKVLRLPASERINTQAWRFHRFTSKSAFKEQLQKLLTKYS